MIRAGVLARVRASIGEEPAPHGCCGPGKECGAGERGGSLSGGFVLREKGPSAAKGAAFGNRQGHHPWTLLGDAYRRKGAVAQARATAPFWFSKARGNPRAGYLMYAYSKFGWPT